MKMQKYYSTPESKIMNIQGHNSVMNPSNGNDASHEQDALGGAPARTLYV